MSGVNSSLRNAKKENKRATRGHSKKLSNEMVGKDVEKYLYRMRDVDERNKQSNKILYTQYVSSRW